MVLQYFLDVHMCKLDATLLIVDDDEAIRETLRELLEAEGYDVRTACNGLEAIRVLNEMSCQPCLVLCDLRMPIMNGDEFIQTIKSDETKKNIPVAIISAAQNASSIKNADILIKKPFSIEEVLAKIQEFCEQKSERRSRSSA